MTAHSTHQAIDGQWHAVYRVPGSAMLHSVGVANTERGAKVMATEAEAAAVKRERALESYDQWEPRPVPRGFYTDADAS